MNLFRRAFLAFSLALVLPAAARAEKVYVYAAASLKEAMDALVPAFAEASRHEAVVSLAGSSALARQIAQGAPAGVFLSANVGWMDQLGAEGMLVKGTRRDILGNALVLIAPGAEGASESAPVGPGFDFAGHLAGGRLAMALVDAVPAGIYGRMALESLGVWEALAPQVAQVDNARAALALVAAGEAPLGIVYATDAQAEPGIHVVARFAEDSHPPIIYPAAATDGSGEGARAFLKFLGSAEAQDIFTRLGFATLHE